LTNRIQRVNQLIKKELSQIILREIEFPPGILVTVTRVETTSNLIEAKIFISVIPAHLNFAKQNLGGPEEKILDVLKILKQNIYELQQKINKRLKMRPVPRISFIEEKKTKEAASIEEILHKLNQKE
jgi:ribosome-binding factor A